MMRDDAPKYLYGPGPIEKRRLEWEFIFRAADFRERMRRRAIDFHTDINDITALDWKQVELFENKIRFDFDVVEIEKKDGKIIHSVANQPTQITDYTEEEFINTVNFYLKRGGNATENLVIWEPQLIKYLQPLKINHCLLIRHQPESWDFLKNFTGKLEFLSISCKLDTEVMKVPIIAESTGITLRGEQPNDIIFASNHYYFMIKDHVLPVTQLKDIYEHWKSIKREEGMFSFDCPPEVYQEYKKQFKTWAKYYSKPVFGFNELGVTKGLCLDFHSDKQIIFIFGNWPKEGTTQLVMAIYERDITDIAAEFLKKIFVFNPVTSIAKVITGG